MGSTRSYDFVTGFETSAAPTATTPTTDNDTVSKGYSDTTYTKRADWAADVADTAALKALTGTGSNSRADNQLRFKENSRDVWQYDASSTATEDGTTVISPDDSTGRWHVISAGSSGSAGTASASELLQTQNQLAGFGYGTRALDNSLRANGLEIPAHTYFTGYLIDNYTSGGATMNIVWNPLQVSDSDKNMDSTTSWSATGAGASLTTSATRKIGSTSHQIDKDGSAVEAGIRFDRAAQTLALGANYRVWFWVNLPSVTNLTNVGLRVYADSTSNHRTWTTTTDYAGSALAIGWNLILVDISTGGSAGGSGWDYTQLSRYQELFLTTSSAGQTYSAILFDALNFSHGDIGSWAPKYLEFTCADTSNKKDIVIASSNTRQDGVLTLGASVASNFTAGISNADRAMIYRSSLSWSQAGLIGFNTGLTSGTISTEEELRLTKVLRESLSGNYGAHVDMFTPQIYKVTSVGGSTIECQDSEDHSANLKNTDSVHIFKTVYSAGVPNFYLLATRAMTADATHLSGTSTLTLPVTDIAVGDYIVKQHLSVSYSVVASTANEAFSAMAYEATPNGAQLIGSMSYPNPNNIWAHWWLGGPSDTLAVKDQSNAGHNAVEVGTMNLADTFKSGKYSASGYTTGNYVRSAGGVGAELSADATHDLVQISFWLYFDSTLGAVRHIVGNRSFHGSSDYRGWNAAIASSGNQLYTEFYNASGSPTSNVSSGAMSPGTWNHFVLQLHGGSVHKTYHNGTLYSTTAGAISTVVASAQALYFGVISDGSTLDSSIALPATGIKMADAIVWKAGSLLTQSDVNYLYNGGVPTWLGYSPAVVRNKYVVTGQSGQRISMKAKLNRTTTAVSPYILNAGMIKTG